MSALPRNAGMSVQLHGHHARFLEDGGEHDGGPGTGREARLAQRGKDSLERLERGRGHLEDVTSLARDVMALKNAWVGCQRANRRLGAVRIGGRISDDD